MFISVQKEVEGEGGGASTEEDYVVITIVTCPLAYIIK